MTVAAFYYVVQYGTVMPSLDDLVMVPSLVPGVRLNWVWAWCMHNEHRIPLPRVAYVGLIQLSRDFRTGTYVVVAMLSGLSLALVFASRSIRGRTSASDAFFPLLWLHWGHSENLLNSFQLIAPLVSGLSLAILLEVTCGRPIPTAQSLGMVGLYLLLFPLCGLFGLLQVPAIGSWLFFAGIAAFRAGRRRAAAVATGGTLAALVLVGYYFVGFSFLPGSQRAGPEQTVVVAFQFLAQSMGWPAARHWPMSGWIVGILCACGAALTLAVAWKSEQERVRAAGILACMVAIALLALGLGFGRGMDQSRAGLLSRYSTLSAPILCAVYLAWTRYGSNALGAFMRTGMCSLWLVLAVLNVPGGKKVGEERVRLAEAFQRDVEAGLPLSELSERHWRSFFYGQDWFTEVLAAMRTAQLGPFRADESTARPPDSPYSMMRTPPIAVESNPPAKAHQLAGREVLLVHPDGELRFAVPNGATRVAGEFGVYLKQLVSKPTRGVRFSVELRVPGRTPRVLFEKVLNPRVDSSAENVHAFDVELPEGAGGELVLRSRRAGRTAGPVDWSFWTGVEIR